MTIYGKATVQHTETYLTSKTDLLYQPLGKTGLWVSQAGYGTYRVSIDQDDHFLALSHALKRGINLIDTSTNYMNGDAERLVGAVLEDLIEKEQMGRENIVIISKAGYVQGETYTESQQRKDAGTPFPDLVDIDQYLEHCIHPDFLDYQLNQSRKRLGLECIDGYLLHNPEYYLIWAEKQGIALDKARDTLYQRFERACQYLETAVSAGKISFYGVSSNTVTLPGDHPHFVSLDSLCTIANTIENNHFNIIQMPCNLLETGAISKGNHDNNLSALDCATKHHLGVLINRPLNAVSHGQLCRLVEYDSESVSQSDIEEQMDMLYATESRFDDCILEDGMIDNEQAQQVKSLICIADPLNEHWKKAKYFHEWQNVMQFYFVPRLEKGYALLAECFENKQKEMPGWLSDHLSIVNPLLEQISNFYKHTHTRELQKIKKQVAKADREWARAVPLTQMAIRALRSTRGIHCILVGMRQVPYVADIITELSTSIPIEDRRQAWKRLTMSNKVQKNR